MSFLNIEWPWYFIFTLKENITIYLLYLAWCWPMQWAKASTAPSIFHLPGSHWDDYKHRIFSAFQVQRHREHLMNYIIFLRITPFLPNWFINITSPVINVPLAPFFFGTFFGKSIQTLTLNMLNCFKDYKIYIHILNFILDLAWPKQIKLTLEQQYTFSILHRQYLGCRCSGDLKDVDFIHRWKFKSS